MRARCGCARAGDFYGRDIQPVKGLPVYCAWYRARQDTLEFLLECTDCHWIWAIRLLYLIEIINGVLLGNSIHCLRWGSLRAFWLIFKIFTMNHLQFKFCGKRFTKEEWIGMCRSVKWCWNAIWWCYWWWWWCWWCWWCLCWCIRTSLRYLHLLVGELGLSCVIIASAGSS